MVDELEEIKFNMFCSQILTFIESIHQSQVWD